MVGLFLACGMVFAVVVVIWLGMSRFFETGLFYVTYFDETNPIRILSIIKPDVHVNGEEYNKDCIEAEVVKKYGGKIYIVKRIPSLSTTNIIEKIKCDL